MKKTGKDTIERGLGPTSGVSRRRTMIGNTLKTLRREESE